MGNRSSLTVYVKGENFNIKERRFYEASIAKDNRAMFYFFNAEDVWNPNIYGLDEVNNLDDLPSVDYIDINGKRYYKPMCGYSKMQEVVFEKHDKVPDSFLSLFDLDDYDDLRKYDGNIYDTNIFIVTVEMALEKIALMESAGINIEGIHEIKYYLLKVPKDSILVLNISEVLKSELNPNYKTLEYYLEAVELLNKKIGDA